MPAPIHRYSGHETFPFRYAWLPKTVRALDEKPLLFTDEEKAMVELGLGKNMVRAARFWAEAAQLIETDGRGLKPSALGTQILLDGGHDPFLEDLQTLWLVHWLVATNSSPLAAWDTLLNHWHEPRFTKSDVVVALAKLAENEEKKKLSDVTLEQHFDVFLHTYLPTRSRKGEVQEDNLDSPLVELALVQPDASSATSSASDQAFSFRVDSKGEISSALFARCLEDYWRKFVKTEQSVPFSAIAYGPNSPGQIFKIFEGDIRIRLEAIERDTNGRFVYVDSSAIPQLQIQQDHPPVQISAIYQQEALYV